MKAQIKFLQKYLVDQFYDAGAVDGIVGPRTLAAIQTAKLAPAHWTDKRQGVGAVQAVLSSLGYIVGQIDGYYGPATDAAFEQYLWIQGGNVGDVRPKTPTVKVGAWPTTDEEELTKLYGAPGTNLARASLPFAARLAWNLDQYVRSFVCHEVVKEPIELATIDILEHYGSARLRGLGLDLFGGCYNDRPVRGGTRRSTHSWAISVDWDTTHNRLKMKAPEARFSGSSYDDWHRIWEFYGFLNLGRVKGYDWQHHRFDDVPKESS